MRGSRLGWFVAALAVALLAVAVGAHALGGLDGLEAGSSHYVEVVDTDSSGVLAGSVTQTERGPLGLTGETVAVETGWVVAHPEGAELGSGPLEVREEIPFEDPNGGTWLQREVTVDGQVGWAVPVDVVREDPTLGAPYNFALVVDTSEVPDDATLTATYHATLDLVEGDAGPAR
jgi:hypothetical protein